MRLGPRASGPQEELSAAVDSQVNAARRSLWEGVNWPPSVERDLTRETSQRTSGTPLHEWDEDGDNLQFCIF